MSPAAALLRRLESGEKIIWWRKSPPVINVPKDIVAQLVGLVEAVERADRESFGRHYRDDASLAAVFRALAALEAEAAREPA